MSRYSDAVLALSPTAYWRLGEPSGTSAADASGNGHTGTYVGSPTLGVAGLLAGDSDTAVTLTGTTQRITAAALSIADTFTIALWYKPAALSTFNTIFAGGGNHLWLFADGGGGIQIWKHSVGAMYSTAGGLLSNGVVAHVVVTKAGATTHVYVNGQDCSLTGSNLTLSAASTTIFGSEGGGWPLDGTPDEPAIWTRALTPSEVAGLWAIGISAGTSPAPPVVEYVVELFDSGGTFGPSQRLAELWDIRNLGWSRYDRMPGRGFFTLYQTSPFLASVVPITTHVRITRVSPSGNVEVFNGIVSDYSSTGDDVLFDIYDYVSLLSLSRSGYRTLYPTVNVGSGVVAPQWLLAKNATSSPLGFVQTGTIEDPLGTDDATPIKTNARFGLMDQMRLALFYDMTEMGRANTIHQVTFEITRTSPFTFNFWKNKGTLKDIPLVLNGSVSDYQYAPNWAARRNDLATLGATVGGGATEVVKTSPTDAASYGLRQDVFAIKTLAGIVGSAVEADQQQAVTARQLKASMDGAPALWLTLVTGVIEPFTGWDICDKMPVEISNGIDSITGAWRVVGTRAMIDEPGERLQVLVAPVLV